MEVARWLVLLVLLGVNTALDCVRKKIFFWVCVVGIVLGSLLQIWKGGLEWRNFGAGIFVGIMMIAIAVISRGMIGIGDGVVLLLMGTWAGGVLTITCCVTAVFLAGMGGVYLIVVKKKSGKETIPFVPFLLISYLINTTQGILEVIQ